MYKWLEQKIGTMIYLGELLQNTAWMQTRSSAIELINRVSLDFLATAVTSTQTQTSKAFT